MHRGSACTFYSIDQESLGLRVGAVAMEIIAMQIHQGRIDNTVSQRDHSGQNLSHNGLSQNGRILWGFRV